ncbi:MAG: glycosyltransferase family 2 protein [Croceimicrobium sp.]
MKAPFYSIVIPVFNAADTLEDCLESVWEQSLSDYELILINDGSTDGSGDFLENWTEQKTGLQFSIIHQENKGLGAARNTGIERAGGKFIALLDADDIWHPQKLYSCHQYLQRNLDTDVLYHRVENFGLNQSYARHTFPIKGIDDLIEKGCPLVPSASIIRCALAQEYYFQTDSEFHGAEDLYLWLELLKAKASFCYWPEALSYYREEGGMSTRIDDHLRNVLNVYEHFYRLNRISKKDYEMATQRKYYEAARFYQKRGNHHQAHHYYSVADSKSLKILGLRILNRLGITI